MKNKYIHLIFAGIFTILIVIGMIFINLKKYVVINNSYIKILINDSLGIALALMDGYALYNFAKENKKDE